MDSFKVSKRVIFDFLVENDIKDTQKLLNYLQAKYSLDDDRLEIVGRNLSRHFLTHFYQKWKVPFNVKSKFEKKFEKWLNSDFFVDFSELKRSPGRRLSTESFDEIATTTKRRRLMIIEETYSEIEIQEAFLRILRTTGRTKTANAIVSLLTTTSSDTNNFYNSGKELECYSAEEALALMEDAKLSKYQYNVIQFQAKKRNADIYPSYHQVADAKKECYPSQIHITETEARINLQSLIDHSITRLFKDPNLKLPPIDKRVKICNLDLLMKYGCDGASDQGTYDQMFADEDSSDATVFTISMVPLCLKVSESSAVVWSNPHPGSPRRCIPIAFIFAKETKELTKREIQEIQCQIKILKPTKVTTPNGVYIVRTDMKLTMVDGKVCLALSDTPSSASCYICGAKPSEMNILDRVMLKEEIIANLEYGISPLHTKMRSFECIIHIGCRLDFKKRCAKTEEEKKQKDAAHTRICKEFKERTGLIIDQPRHGTGNSNSGNTARRFFADPDLAAEITGVNKELIVRFSQILQMLTSSSTKVPPMFFNEFAFETAQLYVSLYPWYFMPPTVHKMLLHGATVMQHFLLPIGQYSEEAAEARNKDFKRFREFNTRKCSRVSTNEDLIHKLLVSSDLLISSLRQTRDKNEVEMDTEILEMIEKYNLKTNSSQSSQNSTTDIV